MGKVYFPRNAPWVNDLVVELLRFPAEKNYDHVDALSLICLMLDHMIKGQEPPEDPDLWRQPTWNDVIDLHQERARRAGGRPQRI
jgi:hypothetical protein